MAISSPRKIAEVIIATVGVSLAAFSLVAIYLGEQNKPHIAPLSEMSELLQEGITDIHLVSTSQCQRLFNVHLSETQRESFLKMLQVAEDGHILGHSNTLAEAELTLSTATGSALYEAAVYDHQPNDLFLSRTVVEQRSNGSEVRWRYKEIRIPNFAKWLTDVAPGSAR